MRASICASRKRASVSASRSDGGGTRKIGADARYQLTEHLRSKARRIGRKCSRRVRSANSSARKCAARWMTTRSASVRVMSQTQASTNGDAESQQAFVNGSVDLFRDLITLHASQDFALGGKNSSVDFPARSLVGVDYHWRADTTFFAEYEHADGEDFDADMTRVGVRTAPWQRAQMQSSMTQQATEFGPRVFANFGLMQGWQMNERWALDFGVDQSRTVRGARLEPFNANVPLASGTLSNDFIATFVGAMYRSEFWTFTSRLENRHSDDEVRLVPPAVSIASQSRVTHSHWRRSIRQPVCHRHRHAWPAKCSSPGPIARSTSAWIVLDRLDLKHESRTDRARRVRVSARHQQSELELAARPCVRNWACSSVRAMCAARSMTIATAASRRLYGVDVRRDLTDRSTSACTAHC